jgi:hypothetical protein
LRRTVPLSTRSRRSTSRWLRLTPSARVRPRRRRRSSRQRSATVTITSTQRATQAELDNVPLSAKSPRVSGKHGPASPNVRTCREQFALKLGAFGSRFHPWQRRPRHARTARRRCQKMRWSARIVAKTLIPLLGWHSAESGSGFSAFDAGAEAPPASAVRHWTFTDQRPLMPRSAPVLDVRAPTCVMTRRSRRLFGEDPVSGRRSASCVRASRRSMLSSQLPAAGCSA